MVNKEDKWGASKSSNLKRLSGHEDMSGRIVEFAKDDTRQIVALQPDSGNLYILERGEAASQREMAKRGALICPYSQCPAPAINTRGGPQVRDHFFHTSSKTELHPRESINHITAKQVIKEWLKERLPEATVTLESTSLGPEHVPDVLVQMLDGTKIAYEIQYSSISDEELKRRTGLYLNKDIVVVWLLGHTTKHFNIVKLANEPLIKVNSTHRALLKLGCDLLWINPNTKEIATAELSLAQSNGGSALGQKMEVVITDLVDCFVRKGRLTTHTINRQQSALPSELLEAHEEAIKIDIRRTAQAAVRRKIEEDKKTLVENARKQEEEYELRLAVRKVEYEIVEDIYQTSRLLDREYYLQRRVLNWDIIKDELKADCGGVIPLSLLPFSCVEHLASAIPIHWTSLIFRSIIKNNSPFAPWNYDKFQTNVLRFHRKKGGYAKEEDAKRALWLFIRLLYRSGWIDFDTMTPVGWGSLYEDRPPYNLCVRLLVLPPTTPTPLTPQTEVVKIERLRIARELAAKKEEERKALVAQEQERNDKRRCSSRDPRLTPEQNKAVFGAKMRQLENARKKGHEGPIAFPTLKDIHPSKQALFIPWPSFLNQDSF